MIDRVRRISVARLRATADSIRRLLPYKKLAAGFALFAAVLLCSCGLAMPHHPSAAATVWVQWPAAPWAHRSYDRPYPGRPPSHGEHLPQWYRRHQNLSPQAQERALRAEPGFNRLPPAKQERLFNRLRQLNAMPPLQRERTLERMEALERLSPEQRQQVRSTMQEITQLPEERRRRMRAAFQRLSQLPPPQRQALLNSPEYKRRYSYQELRMLAIMMSVEPYTTPPPYGPGRMYGGPAR